MLCCCMGMPLCYGDICICYVHKYKDTKRHLCHYTIENSIWLKITFWILFNWILNIYGLFEFDLTVHTHKCYALLCRCVLCINRYAVYDNYLLFMFDLTLFEFFQSNIINLYCIRKGTEGGRETASDFNRLPLETSQQWGEYRSNAMTSVPSVRRTRWMNSIMHNSNAMTTSTAQHNQHKGISSEKMEIVCNLHFI